MEKQEGWKRKERIAEINSHSEVGVKGQGTLPHTLSHLGTATDHKWRQVLSAVHACLLRIRGSHDVRRSDVKLLPSSPSIGPSCCCSQTCPGSRGILLNACHADLCFDTNKQGTHMHAQPSCCLLNIFLLHQIFMPQRQKVMKKRIFSWFVRLSPTQHLFFCAVMRCTTEKGFIVLYVYLRTTTGLKPSQNRWQTMQIMKESHKELWSGRIASWPQHKWNSADKVRGRL